MPRVQTLKNISLVSWSQSFTVNSLERRNSEDPPKENDGDVPIDYVDFRESAEYLTSFLQAIGLNTNNSPSVNFAIHQSNCVIDDLRGLLATEALSPIHAKESIENLALLLAMFLTRKDFQAARTTCEQISSIINACSVFLQRMEERIERPLTDWQGLKKIYDIIGRKIAEKEIIRQGQPKPLKLTGLVDRSKKRVTYDGTYGERKVWITVSPSNYQHLMMIAALALDPSPFIVKYLLGWPSMKGNLVTVIDDEKFVILQKVIRCHGYIANGTLEVIVAQICLAIQHLHKLGITMLNIKPSKFVIDEDIRVKILHLDSAELGLACFLENDYRREGISMDGFPLKVFRGNLRFASPEILNAISGVSNNITRTSDWWCAGVCFHYIATQQRLEVDEVPSEELPETIANLMEFKSRADPSKPERPELFQKFVKNLLKKISGRLGAKQFKDIKEHPYLKYFDWQKWISGEGSHVDNEMKAIIGGLLQEESSMSQDTVKLRPVEEGSDGRFVYDEGDYPEYGEIATGTFVNPETLQTEFMGRLQ